MSSSKDDMDISSNSSILSWTKAYFCLIGMIWISVTRERLKGSSEKRLTD